jgi:hypothetical protein
MHSRATLNYELPEGFSHLVATIGIDDAVRPRGSVVFRVITDGKPAYESKTLTGRDPAENIRVDIRGARTLQLVVDFGEELDVGDQADWANIRLVKSDAAATQPADGS